MERVITVGLGQMVVSDSSETVLVAFGLGSCVGVCAYDPVRKIGGVLHAMLPEHRNGDANRAKYVDTGIMELLHQLVAAGARRDQLQWRFAGGAQMLTGPGMADHFNIGRQNACMAQDVCDRERLRLLATDTGGHAGRTLRLFVKNGRVLVRAVNGEERAL